MDWPLILLIIFGSLMVMMATGMPIAFCFICLDIAGVYFLFGATGIEQVILSIYSSLATFILEPIPLFILMGEVMFHSGMGANVISALDKCMGRLPGRLSLLAVAAGTILATLTGVSIASVAILGSLLLPDMESRGYKKPMTMGPILGSGGLAMLIPPSALAVFLGAIGEISIGKLLIAIVIPGLILAIFYAAYIIIRCKLQPSIAPSYEVPHTPLSEKFKAIIQNVMPIGIIIFLVIGVILLGIATPSEAAATGALAVLVMAFFQKRLNKEVLKKSLSGTLLMTGMIFLIIAGATAFSQILSYTGATRGLSGLAIGLTVHPLFIFVGMQVVIMILGCFINVDAIILLTIPIFIPIVSALGFDRVWFGTIVLVNLEMALITPPFGMSLFVMKGVSLPGTTMRDVYNASFPIVCLHIMVMAILMFFPKIVLWLPGLM